MLSLPLFSYVALMSITPGPNNLMLAASGVGFGFRRTVPHLLGISLGHGVQVALVSLLLSWVLALLQHWRLPLALLGCSYLLWLALQLWYADAPQARSTARPLGLFGAAAFQWINPKAWVMVVNSVLLFLPRDAAWPQALQLAAWCALINLPCIALWAGMGEGLRRVLTRDDARRAFNAVMALALAATALWLLWDEWRA